MVFSTFQVLYKIRHTHPSPLIGEFPLSRKIVTLLSDRHVPSNLETRSKGSTSLIHFSPGPFAKPLPQAEVVPVGSTLLSLWKEVDSGSKSCWSRWNDAYSQGPFSPHWQTQPAEQLRGRIHLMIKALRRQNLEGTTVLLLYHNSCACLVVGYLWIKISL